MKDKKLLQNKFIVLENNKDKSKIKNLAKNALKILGIKN